MTPVTSVSFPLSIAFLFFCLLYIALYIYYSLPVLSLVLHSQKIYVKEETAKGTTWLQKLLLSFVRTDHGVL